jgi:hypothetical protein
MRAALRHALLCSLLVSGCNISDPLEGSNQNNRPTMRPDQGQLDMPAELDMNMEEMLCAPSVTCADRCGMVDDGCGVMLDCGACGCTDQNFADFCESKPCQKATGCAEDGSCAYEPVVCGGQICRCADGSDECEQQQRRCAGEDGSLTCPATFCDPAPMMVAGKVVYENTCTTQDTTPMGEVQTCSSLATCQLGTCAADTCVPNLGCGVCDLGSFDCSDGQVACADLVLPGGLELAQVQCNSDQLDSTFVFVDGEGGENVISAGSRTRPFESFGYAIQQALVRGSRGVIVAGSPTVTRVIGSVELINGLSVYGGFRREGALWTRDRTQRPIIEGRAPRRATPSVGLFATDITEPTVLSGVRIVALTAPESESVYGLVARNAPALVLHDVTIEAQDAAAGRDGSVGAPGNPGNPPASIASGRTCARWSQRRVPDGERRRRRSRREFERGYERQSLRARRQRRDQRPDALHGRWTRTARTRCPLKQQRRRG